MFSLYNILFIIFLNVYINKTIAINTTLKTYKHPFHLGFLLRKEKCPNLLAFHDDSNFSKDMVPVINKVMKDTGLHIEVINVTGPKKSLVFLKVAELLDQYSIPLYYNMRTGKYIIGMTTYENLKTWALDKKPEKMTLIDTQSTTDDEASYRITGFFGRLKRLFKQITLKGEENLLKKYKEGQNQSK